MDSGIAPNERIRCRSYFDVGKERWRADKMDGTCYSMFIFHIMYSLEAEKIKTSEMKRNWREQASSAMHIMTYYRIELF